MKVEKSSLDQVKKRFEHNKKLKEQKQKEYGKFLDHYLYVPFSSVPVCAAKVVVLCVLQR